MMKMLVGVLMRGFFLLKIIVWECDLMVNDVNYWLVEDGLLLMYCERVYVYIYVVVCII